MSEPSEPIDVQPVSKRRGTLLIVDDEEGPRMSLKLIFKDKYDLLMADDGAKAIELAVANDIDVAILDIRMAGMSNCSGPPTGLFVCACREAVMDARHRRRRSSKRLKPQFTKKRRMCWGLKLKVRSRMCRQWSRREQAVSRCRYFQRKKR